MNTANLGKYALEHTVYLARQTSNVEIITLISNWAHIIIYMYLILSTASYFSFTKITCPSRIKTLLPYSNQLVLKGFQLVFELPDFVRHDSTCRAILQGFLFALRDIVFKSTQYFRDFIRLLLARTFQWIWSRRANFSFLYNFRWEIFCKFVTAFSTTNPWYCLYCRLYCLFKNEKQRNTNSDLQSLLEGNKENL